MNQFDMLNMYWNLLFNPKGDILQYFNDSYENLLEFKNWAIKNNKNLRFVQEISEEEYSLIRKANDVEEIDYVLKTNFVDNLKSLKLIEKDKYQIVFLPGLNEEVLNRSTVNKYQKSNYSFYFIEEKISKSDLSLYGVYPSFMQAILNIEKWPGVLIFKDNKSKFIAVNKLEELDSIFNKIESNEIFDDEKNHDTYILHLSDTHLGTKKSELGLETLKESLNDLYQQLNTDKKIKVLFTGDLMESPNRENMYLASAFMNDLKKSINADVTFVLGNHDVITHGFNFLRSQKTKVVAYLLGENIKVYEEDKIIIVKIDSTSEGNLARGKVGSIKLKEIQDELDTISNIDDYTICAMIHHHLLPIKKDDFLKTKWSEKIFIGKMMDSSKALQDSEEVIKFLKKNNVHYVFHGHKHIPYIYKMGDINVIAGGSACGGGVKESRSRYINYNLLKYDEKTHKFVYCLVFFDDMSKFERHRLKINVLED
ncbi:MAG: metallophosphoesterase [Thomasclavelia sp.]|nr:metallophosphoesterase [Thomasclavelia sp.]